MMIGENIGLAFRSFTSNKMRTFLSMLGIVIGIASVIGITSLGASVTQSIRDQIEQAGSNVINVMAGGSTPETRSIFTEEFADELAVAADGIDAALPLQQGNYSIQYERLVQESNTVMGVPADFFTSLYFDPAEGTVFGEADSVRRSSVVALGHDLAETLFPDGGAVGAWVRIFRQQARLFRVVAVMEAKSQIMGISFDDAAFVPYDTYMSRLSTFDRGTRYLVVTSEDADVLAVSDELTAFLTRRTGSADNFNIMSPSTMAEMATGIIDSLRLFLTGVAAISLIVGGIGIMNIMLVSVSERTKEIGIRKALGASPGVIRGQFLTEAVCLTITGGVVGIALGLGLSFGACQLLDWGFRADYSAVAIALAFSSLVGIFFGMYPAVKASRLDPVVALAWE